MLLNGFDYFPIIITLVLVSSSILVFQETIKSNKTKDHNHQSEQVPRIKIHDDKDLEWETSLLFCALLIFIDRILADQTKLFFRFRR